jgi:hypothetical protein
MVVTFLGWRNMVKTMLKQESMTQAETHKLRDVLVQVQQVANQLSASSEELASTS